MVNYTDNIIPAMTSDSMNGFITTASSYYSSNYLPWRAFSRDSSTYWSCSSSFPTGWIACEFPSPKRIIKFTVKNRLDSSSPKAFSFDGFDGTNWITLFQQTASETPNWKDGEKREYVFNNPNEYKRYRLNITQIQTAGYVPEINEIEMMEELILEKTLFRSDSKTYALEHVNTLFETKMISDSAPAPFNTTASSTFSSSFLAWKAFDEKKDDGAWVSSGSPTGWIKIDFGKMILVNNVTMACRGGTDPVITTSMPKDFNIYASNNNINFDLIGSFKNETSWIFLESRNFRFDNSKEYRYFRLDVLVNNGFANYTSIGELLYGYDSAKIIQLPEPTKDNFVKYGQNSKQIMNNNFKNKNYILQDTVSKNQNGLLEVKLNRKPLSISFN